MDGLFEIIVLAIISLPIIALCLRNTNAWMVPGILLIAGAIVLAATVAPLEDDVGGIGALGNGLQYMAALVLAFLSLISFALGGIGRKKRVPAAITLPVGRTFQ